VRDLLPHFQRELAFLQTHSDEFAERYPELGGKLGSAGDLVEDPHVERLLQSFALIAARIHKRLDDDFPRVTEALLEVLYPHYLRPFPSCGVAAFDWGLAAVQASGVQTLPRGTLLHGRPVQGVRCRFRTVYDLQLWPVQLAGFEYRGAGVVPAGVTVPPDVTGWLSLRFDWLAAAIPTPFPATPQLRVGLQGESVRVDALRTAMLAHVAAAYVEGEPDTPWQRVSVLPSAVGFRDEEALLDVDARVHPAYRLLTEMMAFPAKFHFIDLPVPPPAAWSAARGGRLRGWTLHLALSSLRDVPDVVRQLEACQPADLVLHASPVVNLFSQRADPIRVTHRDAAYPVLPDGPRRAHGHEVHAIDRVFCVRQTPSGESIEEFLPFYALRHEQLLSEGEEAARYFAVHRDPTLLERSPGYETTLSIVDIDFDPALPRSDTLSVEVRATNRDLPSLMSVGHPGGDLFMEGGSAFREIRLLRTPTPTHRFERGQGALWRLVSHLSLNHLSLSEGGIEALRELLRLYDLPRQATNRRLIEGLVDIRHRPATACVPGQPFPTLVRGLAITLTVDESAYAGTGLRLLTEVLDWFFALYAHANSFTQLEVISAARGHRLALFPRRVGEVPLL
jgi:type VI secretion system protein ImpG